MATLVSDIINQAFVNLAVITPGETISTTIRDAAFLILQQMWSGWSADQLMSNVLYHQAFTLSAGTPTYTVGTGGSLVSTARPVRITSWRSVSGNFSQAGSVISFDALRALQQNATGKRSVLAEAVAADYAFASVNIEVYPTPDTAPGTLTLDYYGPLTQFATVSDSLTLADGYEQALHYNLAVALAPQYARQSGIPAALLKNATDSKAAIVAKNAAILGLSRVPQQAPEAA